MKKLCLILLFLPCAAALAQNAPAKQQRPALELPLAARQTGHYAASTATGETFPYLSPGGRLSVFSASARVAGLEPDADVGTGGFVLLHGRDGSAGEVRRLEVSNDGIQLHDTVGLKDGGALVAGAPGRYDGRSVIARLSPLGEVLWALNLNQEAPPGCDDSKEMCMFSGVESLVAEGERGWAVVNFRRGVLRFSDGRTVQGKLPFNAILIKLDLREGTVTGVADTRGAADPGMILRAGKLVLANGSRAGGLVVHDAHSLRPVQTLKVPPALGSPEKLVGHSGGFAVVLMKETGGSLQVRDTLVGLDARGKVRFTRDVPWKTQVAAVGSRLYVATPTAIERRTNALNRSSGDFVTNGVVVREFDASGREVSTTTHAGYFDLLSFRLSASPGATADSGEVWLSGVLLDETSARIVVQPALSPVARYGAPPGNAVSLH